MTICAECAELGRDCCHLRSARQNPLAPGDLARIADHTGRPIRKWARQGDDRLYRLRVDARRACCLLGPNGCTLPRRARPVGCLTIPFGMRDGVLYAVASPSECLAVERCRGSAIELFRLLGMDPGELRRLLGLE